ncbi:MAG: DUF4097 family beta strand repeat-containing protein [Bacteroidota bacterium]
MTMLRHATLLVFCCAFSLTGLQAQKSVTLQVVTKNIQKTLPFKNGYEVNIEGEKADVTIRTWEKESVSISLDLVSKHPDKKVAEKDLKSMRYVADRIGKKIYIRNYIALAKGTEKPSSNLKALYTIFIPAKCPVNLTNKLGAASINDLTNELTVESEFCNIQLRNIKGEVNIRTRFGDVEGEQLSGKVNILSQRSNVTLTDLKGVFEIKAKYGVVWIDADESLVDLTISAEKTDVHFLQSRVGEYRYALRAEYGKITVPDFMKFDFTEKTNDIQQAILSPEVQQATVNISTSFGNIVIGRVQR